MPVATPGVRDDALVLRVLHLRMEVQDSGRWGEALQPPNPASWLHSAGSGVGVTLRATQADTQWWVNPHRCPRLRATTLSTKSLSHSEPSKRRLAWDGDSQTR